MPSDPPATLLRDTGQAAPKNSRERVLWEIAERYDELVSPLNGPADLRGSGERHAMMPASYTPTVQEFERLLGVMRNQAKQQAFRGHSIGTLRWHILEYCLKAVRTIKQQPVTVVKRGKKKPVPLRHKDGSPVTAPAFHYVRHPQARKEMAELGISWMAQNWGLKTEPMLWTEPKRAAA